MVDRPMTPSDHVVAQIVTYLATHRTQDAAKLTMFKSILEDVLPTANKEHRVVGPMVDVAEYFTRVDGLSGSEWTRVRYDAARAAEQFAEWRAGLAWEVMQAQMNEPAGEAA